MSLLRVYLHEQLHWYTTWFAARQRAPWLAVLAELGRRYPSAPVGEPEAAATVASTYEHLVVNWLEIEAAAMFL
ncbi:hypothetical protein J8J27_33690, partial [Mycobacterium tuberculosis]|nr:hypothetical protein [Mycobacterium tuberculosis]